MDSNDQNLNEFINAFGIFSSKLGDDDIYKRILLEVIFEELLNNKNKENNHGSKWCNNLDLFGKKR